MTIRGYSSILAEDIEECLNKGMVDLGEGTKKAHVSFLEKHIKYRLKNKLEKFTS
jgi:hypothetical protein